MRIIAAICAAVPVLLVYAGIAPRDGERVFEPQRDLGRNVDVVAAALEGVSPGRSRPRLSRKSSDRTVMDRGWIMTLADPGSRVTRGAVTGTFSAFRH